MISQTVSEMNVIMMTTKYPFQRVEEIFNFFANITCNTIDKELYQLSLEVEPKKQL